MANCLFTIPAFNEEATIGSVVQGLLKYGQVLVVDDGSRDGTADVASAAGATVHRHQVNAGYDAALATCLTVGQQFPCDWLLTIDADGQHKAEDIEHFRSHFRDKDLIIGRRPYASMRVGERLLGLYYRRKHHVCDPLSGFKAYRRDLLLRVTMPSPKTTISYGLDILDAVLSANPRIAEEMISIRERQDDARIGDSWKVNKRMFHCLYSKFKI